MEPSGEVVQGAELKFMCISDGDDDVNADDGD